MPWGVGCDAMLEMSVLIFGTVRCKQFDGDCGGRWTIKRRVPHKWDKFLKGPYTKLGTLRLVNHVTMVA